MTLTPERLAKAIASVKMNAPRWENPDDLMVVCQAADNLAALLASVSDFCDDELTHHMRVGWDRGPIAYVEHVHGEAEKLFKAAHAIKAKG